MLGATHWGNVGAILGGIAAIVVVLLGAIRWSNLNIAKPLRTVMGEPETADDPGKPSLYTLTKEAKETGEMALAVANRLEIKQADIANKVETTASELAETVSHTAADLARKVAETTTSVTTRLDGLDRRLADHIADDNTKLVGHPHD